MKTMRIIPWNEQMIPKGGDWVKAYRVAASAHAWIKTPEQKRKPKVEEEAQIEE